jgi:hypothetical protein
MAKEFTPIHEIRRQQKLSIIKWLKANYESTDLIAISDIDLYDTYIKHSHDHNLSKTMFSRIMRDLGFERKSKRFNGKPGKAYVYMHLIPCPNCTNCNTCNNKRYIKKS